MGNRAVITASKKGKHINPNEIGVYLHWHGGEEWVEAFLTYCRIRRYRLPENDNYGWACLVRVIGNTISEDGLSVGIDRCANLDCKNGDNGVYFIKGWKIVDREFASPRKIDRTNMLWRLLCIDHAQPAWERIGDENLQDWLYANLDEFPGANTEMPSRRDFADRLLYL